MKLTYLSLGLLKQSFFITKVMNEASNPVVTEEPFPGWVRSEVAGSTPCYKSPFPRTTLTSQAKLKQFLTKEHAAGRYLDVNGSEFSFKRRLGLRSRSSSVAFEEGRPPCPGPERYLPGEASKRDKVKSPVELLTRNPEITVDHRKLVSMEAKKVDGFRANDAYDTPDNFNDIKVKMSAAANLRELLAVMTEDSKINESLTVLMSDMCLSEVSHINHQTSPLGRPSSHH